MNLYTRWAAVLSVLILIASAVHAASESYPVRPVRILVPLTSGGNMDTITRALAQKLTESFGQNVIVDNRPGAGSQIALEILASSAPDGHTLTMISLTPVTHPMLYTSRFDLFRDFTPVSQVIAQGYVFAIYPGVPAKTVGELVQHLRANPGKLAFMSTGIGSPIHLTSELFLAATGTRMLHVPYRGAFYQDLASGLVQVGFPTVTSAKPYLQNGRLRALAVTTPKRMSALPDLPTFAEAGVNGMVVVNWYGLIAPGRTPAPIVERIALEVSKAMHSAELTKRAALDSSEPIGSSPAEFAAHLRAERERWSRVIKDAGIRGQ